MKKLLLVSMLAVSSTLAIEAATLHGKITDSKTGNVLPGAVVTLTNGDKTYTTNSGGDGMYSIEFPAAASYEVVVEDDTHYRYTSTLEATEDKNYQQDYSLTSFGTSREFKFSLRVVHPTEASLKGVTYTLHCDRFDINYSSSETTLSAEGVSTLNTYAGRHSLSIVVPGMEPVFKSILINQDTEMTINLEEVIEAPYSLKTEVQHNVYTGKNDIALNWNSEEALFFDDFEAHDAFTINPTPWIGLDLDKYPAVALQGSYPNREKPQYITIVNPSAVDPAWDIQYYYTMAPRNGKQYAAFVQPAAGSNNDWLITPQITLGSDNYVRFYARTADAVPGRIKVGITTAENPTQTDFMTISEGNWIRPGYEDWQEVIISLKDYVGQTVRIGINCTSEQGTVMTMIDDFFVGRINNIKKSRSQRMPMHSPANPNETFIITLNGEKVGEVDNYDFTIENVAYGEHEIGVQAKLLTGLSEVSKTNVNINADDYASLNINVAANNGLGVDGYTVLVKSEDAQYPVEIAESKAHFEALPKGNYEISMDVPGYELYQQNMELNKAEEVSFTLTEDLVAPFNITADIIDNGDGTMDALMQWNRDLGFADSFETYKDFSVDTFGDWTTHNFNGIHQVSYPISFSGYEVTFPGASTQDSPTSIPPMVFNPLKTSPSLQEDASFLAPDGNKYVAFFGPQGTSSDKWLISPQIKIYDKYELQFTAKAYPIYPETIEVCISTTDNAPGQFTILDTVVLSYEEWTTFTVDLSAYAGKEVYIGFHHTTFDGFVGQLDDVKVAPSEEAATHGSGFAQSYDISLDGNFAANSIETNYNFDRIAATEHIVGIKANFRTGASSETFYSLSTSGIDDMTVSPESVTVAKGEIILDAPDDCSYELYTTSGIIIERGKVMGRHHISVAQGIYILNFGEKVLKLYVK